MNTKQLASLLIVLVVAGIVALVTRGSRDRNVDKVGGSTGRKLVMPGFPVNEIASVSIRGKDGLLQLEKQESGWVVVERSGYPADFNKVGGLLKTVFDLAVVQTIPVGASKFGRVGLLDPAEESSAEESATILAFKDGKSNETGALWVGKEYKKEERSQFGTFDSTAGRYVRRAGSDEVHLVSEEFRDAKTDPKEWISKDFFKVSKIKTIGRTVSDSAQSWKLTRESDTADFTLVDAKEGEELDSTKVSPMKNAFTSPSFEDVLVGEDVAKPSLVTFEVETFEGFRYDVKIGPKNEANEFDLTVKVSGEFPAERPAPAEEESEEDKKQADEDFAKEIAERKKKLAEEAKLAGHVYRVRGFVADSINKDRSELLKGEEAPAGDTPEASAIPGLDSVLPGIGNN